MYPARSTICPPGATARKLPRINFTALLRTLRLLSASTISNHSCFAFHRYLSYVSKCFILSAVFNISDVLLIIFLCLPISLA